MKDLISVSLILLLLFGGWVTFLYYSEHAADALMSDIQDSILPAIRSEDWPESIRLMDQFQERWDKFYRISLYFHHAEPLNEIDTCISKAIEYVKSADRSNASGELLAVSHHLDFLNAQEHLTFRNIF